MGVVLGLVGNFKFPCHKLSETVARGVWNLAPADFLGSDVIELVGFVRRIRSELLVHPQIVKTGNTRERSVDVGVVG